MKKVIKKIINNKLTISFTESITGGSLVSTFTKVPGSSISLKESYVTYSNESKIKILNVDKETIEKYGVVSKDVSIEMAKGLKEITNSSICISTTGNAGPTTCDNKEGVGKVFTTIIFNEDIYSYELDLKGTRSSIINKTVRFIYNKLNELMKN